LEFSNDAKIVKSLEHLHYENRLENLGLTCSDRRCSSDLNEIFMIISGNYDIRRDYVFRTLMKVAARERGLTLENLFSLTELLTNGTRFPIVLLR